MGKRNPIRNESFIDKYDKIVNRSTEEIKFIRSTYKWYLALATGLLILTVTSAYFLLRDNISGYEEIINRDLDIFLLDTREKQDSLNNNFLISTSDKIDSIISLNFETRKITNLIETEAKVKVDSFSNDYLDNLVKTSVEPKLLIVNNQVSEFDDKMQLFEFYLSKVAAFNDDRISFDKLYEISKNKKNKYWNEAGQVYQAIITQYSQPQIPPIGYTLIDEGGKFDWAIEKCINEFYLQSKYNRITMLDHIFSKEKYDKEDRKRIAMYVLEHGTSLDVVNKASKYLIKTYSIDARSLEINKVLNAVN